MAKGDGIRRFLNTLGVAPRGFGAGFSGALDIVSAPLYGALDSAEMMGRRSVDIKTAIDNAIKTGKHWQRWLRRPLAVATGVVSYTTGLLRSIATGVRDTAGYLLQAVGNTFNNAGSAVLWIGEKTPVKDFSFAKLQPQRVTMGSVMQRRFPALGTTAPAATPRTPRPAPTAPTPAPAAPRP